MRNYKRIMAVTAAGTMLLSSVTVFAADNATSGEINGSGSIEQDNSTDPSYADIVLPTMTAGQYSFLLDPSKILHDFNPDVYTSATDTVYFQSVKTAAKLENKEDGTATDQKLYISQKNAEADTDGLKAKLTAAGSDITALAGDFYLWVPDADSDKGAGKYLKLDIDGVKKYFDIDYTDPTTINTLTFKNTKVEDSACDGKVYVDEIVVLADPYDVKDHVTIKDDGTVDATADVVNLYYKDKTSGAYTAIDKTAFDTYVKYTPPVIAPQSDSDVAKIVNKSTAESIVTVNVTIEDAPGLEFNSTDTFTDTKTSMYLAIENTANALTGVAAGATPVATVNDVSSATATYELKGADQTNALKYQKAEIDPITGSHKYVKYEAHDVAYDTISFNLTGKANDTAGVKWDEYSDGLTSRPAVNVVFSVAPKSNDRLMTLGLDGNNAILSYQFTSEAPTTGTIDAITIDGVDRIGAVVAGNITYVSDTLTIKTAPLNTCELVKNGTHTIVATIDGTEYTFKYIVTDDYVMALASGEVTYTFDNAPTGTLTALEVDATDRTPAIGAGNVTYDSSTGIFKFNSTAHSGCELDVPGDHEIIATIGGVNYTFTYTQS